MPLCVACRLLCYPHGKATTGRMRATERRGDPAEAGECTSPPDPPWRKPPPRTLLRGRNANTKTIIGPEREFAVLRSTAVRAISD